MQIAVFLGARPGKDPRLAQAARALDGERAWLCLRRLEQADGSFVPALCRVTED